MKDQRKSYFIKDFSKKDAKIEKKSQEIWPIVFFVLPLQRFSRKSTAKMGCTLA
jgi:hypothetical protein